MMKNVLVYVDLNSPSTIWENSTTTTVLKNTEDFLDTYLIKSSSANDFTFINTRRSKTNPDLIFFSSQVNNSHSDQQLLIVMIGSHG